MEIIYIANAILLHILATYPIEIPPNGIITPAIAYRTSLIYDSILN